MSHGFLQWSFLGQIKGENNEWFHERLIMAPVCLEGLTLHLTRMPWPTGITRFLIFRRARLDKSFSAPLSSTPWLNERPGESGWHTGTAMCEATRPHKDQLCFPFIHIIEIDISMWFYALWLSFYWWTREINNSHFETIVRHLHSLYSGYYIIYNYW